jgi:hypothetical protein
MGWVDCHLHELRVAADSKLGRIEHLGIPVDDLFGERKVRPDWTVPVSDVVGKVHLPMLYVYDFGDDWQHVVMYEGGARLDRRMTYPRCIAGARKCPPEDCGGVHAYAEFLEALGNPKHPRHAELLDWAGPFDPDHFDAARVEFDDPQRRWKRAFEHSPS